MREAVQGAVSGGLPGVLRSNSPAWTAVSRSERPANRNQLSEGGKKIEIERNIC